MGRAVIHFEITGDDPAGLRSFYSELFGWQVGANHGPGYWLVQAEESAWLQRAGIGGAIGAGPPGHPGRVVIYVEVPDIEAALVSAEALGGSRMFGPQSFNGFEIGLFRDPEGHMTGGVRPETELKKAPELPAS
jgi:predicted enzyme related to lactoylglutathione lyase